MTMGHIQESYSVPSTHPERQQEDLNRFTEMAQSLAAGNKLPLSDLQWYIEYAERHWFFVGTHDVRWRNKSKGTLYTFEGVTLRVTDSEISPVVLWVDFAPVDNHMVKFSREANEFLRKFEPVAEATTWEPLVARADRLPGALA